jgi:SAM-dependent methyltransferase
VTVQQLSSRSRLEGVTSQRERRSVFGEVVEDYDRYRSGYPAALVDDVLAAAGPAGPALEVGAGTGKATVSFAARGVDLTCIEPDTRMAAVLRRHVPEATVIETPFESWSPDRAYRLLFSAQAWHWVDPARRADLAHAALEPGGVLALFWNVGLMTDREMHAALAEIDSRYFPAGDHTTHGWLIDDVPREVRGFTEEWPELGLDEDRFTDLETRRYHSTVTSPSADYRRLLATTSIYRMLDDDVREAALTETIAAIDARGGTITMALDTDLALGRRR